MELVGHSVFKVLVGVTIFLLALTACQSAGDFTHTADTLNLITETPTKLLEPTAIIPATFTPFPTKQPTETVTITPSLVALEGTAVTNPYFSLVDANTTPPEDIIEEVMYFFGAGPGFCGMMWNESESLEIEACPGEQIEQMGYLMLLVTGMNTDDPVTLTITFPDGAQLEKDLTAGNRGGLTYEYIPELTDQAGVYIFSFQTPQGVIKKDITVIQPPDPRLYLLRDENQMELINFSPNEQIRLFYFGSKLDFGLKAWQYFQADSEGSLTIDYPPLEWPLFVAVGETSGQVTFQEKGAASSVQSWDGGDIFCPGAPPPLGLQEGDEVVVVESKVLIKLVKYTQEREPDIQYISIPEGTKVSIAFYWWAPVCEDQSIWWNIGCPQLEGVDCESDPSIWIPEGYGDTYFILKVIE